jgi:hypothetical protein
MRRSLALVRLFWQHLIRRKSLWVVVALVGMVLLINATIQSQMKAMIEEGVRYDIATRRAAAALDRYAEQIRQGAVMLVVVVAALIAPASRKEGTTQFVLTLSVSRLKLAAAQFGALAVFVLLGTLVVHAGYHAAAYRLGILKIPEALFGWAVFLVPLLLLAAVILLGVPNLALPLLSAFVGSWSVRVPELARYLAARVIDNAGLLFPRVETLIVWPGLWFGMPERPPYPAWGWEATHQLCVVGLWVVIGLWAYRRYDFGSRIPMK